MTDLGALVRPGLVIGTSRGWEQYLAGRARTAIKPTCGDHLVLRLSSSDEKRSFAATVIGFATWIRRRRVQAH